MGFLKVLLIVIEFFTALLLVAIILIQKSKDEGLGLAFGAGVGESLFGSRAGNVLTRITIVLTFVFLLNTLFLGMISSKSKERSVVDGLSTQPVNTQPLLPTTTPAPVGGDIQSASPAPYVPSEMPVAAPSESVPAEPAPTPATP